MGMGRVKRIETTGCCLLDLDLHWTQIIIKTKSEIDYADFGLLTYFFKKK